MTWYLNGAIGAAPSPVDAMTQGIGYPLREVDSSGGGTGYQITDIRQYGGIGNGPASATEDTQAFQDAINFLSANGGGTLIFPQGQFDIISAIDPAPTQTADVPPRAAPIICQGVANAYVNRSIEPAPTMGTVLNFRYAALYGKWAVNVQMIYGFRDLTITASENFSTPLIYSTNGIPIIEGVYFAGQSGSGQTCAQDAIILGGPNQVEGGSGWEDGFQGYGGWVRNNIFRRIKRCIHGQAFFNGFPITGNTVWNDCGAPDDTAAIDIDCGQSMGTQANTGDELTANLIEVTNYAYGVRMGHTLNNFARNSFYDASQEKSKACYKVIVGGSRNRLETSYQPSKSGGGLLPLIDDDNIWTASGDTPTYISGTSFSVSTDKTGDYRPGRRVRIAQTGASASKLVIAEIESSTFSTVTTVVITLPQGATAIDPSISAVDLEIPYTSGTLNVSVSATPAAQSVLSPFDSPDDSYANKVARLEVNYSQGRDALLVQPVATAPLGAGVFLASIYKAAIDGGAPLFRFKYDGNIQLGDPSGIYYQFNGQSWDALNPGNNLDIDTGPGGSYLRVLGFGMQFRYYVNGATKAEVRWSDGYFDFRHPVSPMTYTVAGLPSGSPGAFKAGTTAYATDGRKSGEGAGSGTGTPVWWDGTNWRTFYDNSVAAA